MNKERFEEARSLLMQVIIDQRCDCELSDWEATDDCWHNKVHMASELLAAEACDQRYPDTSMFNDGEPLTFAAINPLAKPAEPEPRHWVRWYPYKATPSSRQYWAVIAELAGRRGCADNNEAQDFLQLWFAEDCPSIVDIDWDSESGNFHAYVYSADDAHVLVTYIERIFG